MPGKASGKKRGIRATTVRENNSSQAQEKIDRLMKLAAETSQFLPSTARKKIKTYRMFSLVILNKVARSKSTGGFHMFLMAIGNIISTLWHLQVIFVQQRRLPKHYIVCMIKKRKGKLTSSKNGRKISTRQTTTSPCLTMKISQNRIVE